MDRAVSLLDGAGEFSERMLDASTSARVDAELVVASSNVLHERVAADDHLSGELV